MKVQIEGLRFQDNEPSARFGEFPARAIDALIDVYGLRSRVQNPSQLFSNELVAEMHQFDRDKIVQQARSFKV